MFYIYLLLGILLLWYVLFRFYKREQIIAEYQFLIQEIYLSQKGIVNPRYWLSLEDYKILRKRYGEK